MKTFCWTLTLAVMTLLLVAFAAPGYAQDQEELKFELPEPFFGGTPIDYWSENLEKEDFKDRPAFMAPKGTVLVSKGKPVTSSEKNPALGELKMVTDGDKNYAKSSVVELGEGPQWVQVDLGAAHNIYAVLVWHYHAEKRVYFDFTVQVSDDPEFKTGVATLYSNDTDNSLGLETGADKEYIENHKGRLVDAKGVKARYVRLYSNGNTSDEKNHYVEVEVFGVPAG